MGKSKKKKKRKVDFVTSLAQLRNAKGLKQADVKDFDQASISKIESRKDLKLSTLIAYLEALEFDLEIKAKPRVSKAESLDEYLLIATTAKKSKPPKEKT